jgi:hypothetical protein
LRDITKPTRKWKMTTQLAKRLDVNRSDIKVRL